MKAVCVTHILPVVVPEGLPIEATEKMERLNTDVGTTDTTLQQRPEVLKAVGVDAPVDVLNSVVNDLVRVVGSKSLVAEEEVSVESRTSLNMLADLGLQDGLGAARHNSGADLTATLKDAHDGYLVFGASASDAALALAEVHVPGLAANEGFVRFDLTTVTADLQRQTVLHCETDTVQHEPCALLSNAQSAGEFTGANAILAVGDEPNSGEPLLKSKRAVLKDGAHLGSELTLAVGALALPLALFASHDTSVRLQVGQITPFGQSFRTLYRMQLSASAK